MAAPKKQAKRAKKPAKVAHEPPSMVTCCLRSLGDGRVDRLPVKPYRCPDPEKDLPPAAWEWAIEDSENIYAAYPRRSDRNLTELCRRGGILDQRLEADSLDRLFAPVPFLERRKGLQRSLLGYAAKRRAMGDPMTSELAKGLLGLLIAHWKGEWPKLPRPVQPREHEARFASLEQLVEAATYRSALLGWGPSIRPFAANAARTRATWSEIACHGNASSSGSVRSLEALERELDATRWFDVAAAGLDPVDIEAVRRLVVEPPRTPKGRIDWSAFLQGYRRRIAHSRNLPPLGRELSDPQAIELTADLSDDALRRRVRKALGVVQARLATFPSAAASLAQVIDDPSLAVPLIARSAPLEAPALDRRGTAARARAEARREALRKAYAPVEASS
jgi:hypothetical protein